MPKSADAFSPDRSLVTVQIFALVLLMALANLASAESTIDARLPVLAPADPALPIELNAAFSEFDRRNNRLIFRQLNIVQGALAIQADEATAAPADFENSVWIFTGNVTIRNAGTTATCDHAELTFLKNRLQKAALTGQPAHFIQAGTAGKSATEGRGKVLVYDLDAATIEMTNDAFLSDGQNEISGSRIAYDLRREVVTAGASDSGQVHMRITPPRKSK